jgi:hypothetical protein
MKIVDVSRRFIPMRIFAPGSGAKREAPDMQERHLHFPGGERFGTSWGIQTFGHDSEELERER